MQSFASVLRKRGNVRINVTVKNNHATIVAVVNN